MRFSFVVPLILNSKLTLMKTRTLMLAAMLLLPTLLHAQQDTSSTKKEGKKFGITGVPDLSFDRSRGFGFGAMGMMVFDVDKKHPQAPPSQLSIMGTYTTKKNWYVMSFARLFLHNDDYRVMFGGGYMNSNFQTYVNIGDESVVVPYNTYGTFFFGSPSIRVYDRIYVGVSFQFFRTHLIFDESSLGLDNTTSNSYQNALGLNILYDSKDNQFSPSKGLFAGVIYKNFPSWLGNDSIFSKLNLMANYYLRLNPHMILASRASGEIAVGNSIPFIAQSYVGNKDIRGYTKGEYRGNQVYAIQSELRWNMYKAFGMVGFFGLAMAHSPGETSPVLPGGGIGVRYKVLPKFNLNIGVDGALGKDDWGVYFRIGEAF